MNWLITLVLLITFTGLPSCAQDKPSLKPAVPQLDTVAPQIAPPITNQPAVKPGGALKGGVQRTIKQNPPNMRSGIGKADWDRFLHGDAQDQGGLSGSANSGVGIIGVKFVMSMGRPPVINRVFPLTPAFKVGLQTNDIIVAVDGIPTVGLSKEEVYDMIVGLPGTEVTLSIQRQGEYMSHTMLRMDLNDITDPYVRRDYLTHM